MNNETMTFKKEKTMNIEIDTTKSTDQMIEQVLPTLLDAIKENPIRYQLSFLPARK